MNSGGTNWPILSTGGNASIDSGCLVEVFVNLEIKDCQIGGNSIDANCRLVVSSATNNIAKNCGGVIDFAGGIFFFESPPVQWDENNGWERVPDFSDSFSLVRLLYLPIIN